MSTPVSCDSSPLSSTPLSSVWHSVLGSAAESLIDFLQTLNDELDTTQTHVSADVD